MGVGWVRKFFFFGRPLQITWAKFFGERMSVETYNEWKEWVRSSLGCLGELLISMGRGLFGRGVGGLG